MDQGFGVVPGVLTEDMVAELRRVTDEDIDKLTPEQRAESGHMGVTVPMAWQHEVFARLIAWEPTLSVLRDIGNGQPRWLSGFAITREPGANPLYWHQDWIFWNDPVTAHPMPTQVFCMYYLTDTSPTNGCLRVVPRSHRIWTRLHSELKTGAHDEDVRKGDGEGPAFQLDPDEVDVPMRAGDLLVGDARLFHASHGNRSTERRTVMTLWYYPAYELLSEETRAAIQHSQTHMPIPAEYRAVAGHVMPDYAGSAEPRQWSREPNGYLAGSPSGS